MQFLSSFLLRFMYPVVEVVPLAPVVVRLEYGSLPKLGLFRVRRRRLGLIALEVLAYGAQDGCLLGDNVAVGWVALAPPVHVVDEPSHLVVSPLFDAALVVVGALVPGT